VVDPTPASGEGVDRLQGTDQMAAALPPQASRLPTARDLDDHSAPPITALPRLAVRTRLALTP
jgi:hypothetical protein